MCKTTSFELFFHENYATRKRHAANSFLPPSWILLKLAYTVRSNFVEKMSSDEYSDNEIPHDSFDEEVLEEEKMSSDDDSDCGPGFSAPRAPGLHVV